jgi:ATP-dependent DNA helicase RecG
MTPEALKHFLLQGEGQTLEFKLRPSEDIGKTLCAFGNTNDGTILVGVSDSKELVGSSRKMESQIANIAHSCKPSIYPEIKEVEMDGKAILVVKVKKSGAIHSYRNIAYKRVGSHDNPLSPEELIEFAKGRGKITFDDQICSKASLKDIDSDKVGWYLDRREAIRGVQKPRTLDVEGILLSIEAARKIKGQIRLTNAGILFFGKNSQNFLPAAVIRCARFKDKLMRNFIDQAIYRGTIPEMIDEAAKFVERNVKLGGTRELGIRRQDRLEYPLVVIREAVTNAVAHRDYFSPSDVRIAIFEDMLKVFNPGGFPEGFDPRHPTHIPRNRVLCNLLYDVGYIENGALEY